LVFDSTASGGESSFDPSSGRFCGIKNAPIATLLAIVERIKKAEVNRYEKGNREKLSPMRRHLEKVLFPGLDRSRRRYETNVLFAAWSVGLALGGLLAAVIFYYNSRTHTP
jgi:hypothetical protein